MIRLMASKNIYFTVLWHHTKESNQCFIMRLLSKLNKFVNEVCNWI